MEKQRLVIVASEEDILDDVVKLTTSPSVKEGEVWILDEACYDEATRKPVDVGNAMNIAFPKAIRLYPKGASTDPVSKISNPNGYRKGG